MKRNFTGSVIIVILGLLALWVMRSQQPLNELPKHAHGPEVEHQVSSPSSGAMVATLTGEAAEAEMRKNGQYESLGEAFSAARHRVEKLDPTEAHSRGAQYFAANPKQRMRAWFGENGVELSGARYSQPVTEDERRQRKLEGREPRTRPNPWNVSIRLKAYGRMGKTIEAGKPEWQSRENRVETVHDGQGFTEWFENGHKGMEHGFTVTLQPPGWGECEFILSVDGELTAQTTDTDSVHMIDPKGTPAAEYGGLKVFDADGETLPSRMEVRGTEIALVFNDTQARYPVTVDPYFANLEMQLRQSVANPEYDEFGQSIAVLGNVALIGAPASDNPVARGAGSVYVFSRGPSDNWIQRQQLFAENGKFGDAFGQSVALAMIDGRITAIIGAPFWDGANVVDSGNTYLFEALMNDTASIEFSEVAFPKPPDLKAGDWFGFSVALSEDKALIGAPAGIVEGRLPGNFDGIPASAFSGRSGRAFVYGRDGDGDGDGVSWVIDATLAPTDGELGDAKSNDFPDSFGWSVALSGNQALIGAPFAKVKFRGVIGSDAGKAYFFRFDDNWIEQQIVTLETPFHGKHFGTSVALEAGIALVVVERANGRTGATAFVLDGMQWKSDPMFPASTVRFGNSVALSVSDENATTATALLGGSNGNNSEGLVWAFERSGDGHWTEMHVFTAQNPSRSFGVSVALDKDQDRAFVGFTEYDDALAGTNVGSVYEFDLSDGSQRRPIAAEFKPVEVDHLGSSVALSDFQGTTKAIIGAPTDDTQFGLGAGSAYVFFLDRNFRWRQEAKLLINESLIKFSSEPRFGFSVALAGNAAIVGAPLFLNGSAFLYRFANGSWGADPFRFGSLDWLDLHIPFRSMGLQIDGSIDLEGLGKFGNSVAISCDMNGEATAVLIGDPLARYSQQIEFRRGAAFIIEFSEEGWGPPIWLVGDKPNQLRLGASVALSDKLAVVGGVGEAYVYEKPIDSWANARAIELLPDDRASDGEDGFGSSVGILSTDGSEPMVLVGAPVGGAGSAYIFVRNEESSDWSQQAKLTAINGKGGDRFGNSVAISDSTALGSIALVGAPLRDGLIGEPQVGSAFVFRRGGQSLWHQELELRPAIDVDVPSTWFGHSVALHDDLALVGAPLSESREGLGSVYQYILGELPEIVDQPQSQTVNFKQVENAKVAFRTTVKGSAPFQFRWRKNGNPITLDDDDNNYRISDEPFGSTLTISNVGVGDAGLYDTVVSNRGGVATSKAATLDVSLISQFEQQVPDERNVSGSLKVEIKTSGIGGAWRFPGEQTWRAPGSLGGLAIGERMIEFRPVPGYGHPAPITVLIGEDIPFEVIEHYEKNPMVTETGRIRVNLVHVGMLPASPMRWRLLKPGDSGTWLKSGEQSEPLPLGKYEVEAEPVSNKATPKVKTVVIGENNLSPEPVTLVYVDPPPGAAPEVLSFAEVTNSVNQEPKLPYAYVGRIRAETGFGTGFVVKERVVATAAHVVFDQDDLAAHSDLEWRFQSDHDPEGHDPKPQIPRGCVWLDGYASARIDYRQESPHNDPSDSSSSALQETDVAALWFWEEVGRDGFSGFLASNGTLNDAGVGGNEWLQSDEQKTLVGYPAEGIPQDRLGRMHATPPGNVRFSTAGGVGSHTYKTTDIQGLRGNSGGPLCVQLDEGAYYPAAIYVSGTGQTVVRAIDGEVVSMFNRAEAEGNGGRNSVGGGITNTEFITREGESELGGLHVLIEPEKAQKNAYWNSFSKEHSFAGLHDRMKLGLKAGMIELHFPHVDGFFSPAPAKVKIEKGKIASVTYTYEDSSVYDAWVVDAKFDNPKDMEDSADPDGDGLSNIEEFRADTSPTDPIDKPWTVTANDVRAIEGKSEITIEVDIEPKSGHDFFINFATVAGSAKPGEDFVMSAGEIMVEKGRSKVPVSVLINDDDIEESAETFTVTLEFPNSKSVIKSPPVVLRTSSATVIIEDDEGKIDPPMILENPLSKKTLMVGEQLTLKVDAIGSELTYQWRKDGDELPGEVAAELSIAKVTKGDTGLYKVVVSNRGGQKESTPVVVTVNDIEPKFGVPHPEDITFTVGQPVTILVDAVGEDLSYQWRKNGEILVIDPSRPGARASKGQLIFPNAKAADAGNYTLEISNSGGTITSDVVILNTPYQAWEKKNELAENTPQGDPDGDGWRNLFEYYYGTDPRKREVGRRPRITLNRIEKISTIEYAKSPGITDVQATIEASANMRDWNPVIDGQNGVKVVETEASIKIQLPIRMCDLSLMSVPQTSDIPDTGESLVIIASVSGKLHIRIFDYDGERVVNKSEGKSEGDLIEGPKLSALKDLLNMDAFPAASGLSPERRQQIIEHATSVSDHSPISCPYRFVRLKLGIRP